MFSSLRLVLLIFLAMMQFIAPLVHAHADQSCSRPGLHVPGLELLYGAASERAASQTQSHVADSGGFIFSVDTGIKQGQTLTVADSHSDYYLPQPYRVFRAVIPSLDTDAPPQISRFVSSLPSPSRSPRAPPV